MHIPLLLLSLAAGYGVLVGAKNQTKGIKNLGRFLGAIIILVSLGGLICVARYASCGYKGKTLGCETGTMKPGCPLMEK